MMIALAKFHMPQIYLITLLGLSCFIIPQAFGDITIQNSNFEMIDSNLNVTNPITIESFALEGDGFTTRLTTSDSLRKYSFDNATSVFDVRWDSIDATKIQFTITDVVTDVRGNGTGTIFLDVELDDISVAWEFTTLNIVDIDEADKVEYFFEIVTDPSEFDTIIITLNSASNRTLGGVFSGMCDFANNFTMVGIWQNGTIRCEELP